MSMSYNKIINFIRTVKVNGPFDLMTDKRKVKWSMVIPLEYSTRSRS